MAQELEEEHVHSLSSMGHKLLVKNFVWTEEGWPTINFDDFANGDEIGSLVSEEFQTGCKMRIMRKFVKPWLVLVKSGDSSSWLIMRLI